MARIKGSALLGALGWVSMRYGADLRGSVAAGVDSAWSEVFEHKIRPATWYPYGAYQSLLVEIESNIAARGDYDTMHDVGLWTAERDLGGILRIVAAFLSPESVVKRGFGSWGQTYWSRFCDAGSVRLAHLGDGSARIALDGFPEIAPQHCHLMEGWWQTLTRSAGGLAPRVDQSLCVHRGDPCCEWRGHWQRAS